MQVAGVGLALAPPSVLTQVVLGPVVAHGGLTYEGGRSGLEAHHRSSEGEERSGCSGLCQVAPDKRMP